jgi:DNA-directed RNA polymerase specialized sigma subunit
MIAWKYINKTEATIAAIRDYENMTAIIEITPDSIAELKDEMLSPRRSVIDGMPKAHNPKAGEERLVTQLGRIDLLQDRFNGAQEYMEWFEPAWISLTEREQHILRECYMADSLRSGARLRLAEELHYSERHVDNLRDKALKRLQTLLFG